MFNLELPLQNHTAHSWLGSAAVKNLHNSNEEGEPGYSLGVVLLKVPWLSLVLTKDRG